MKKSTKIRKTKKSKTHKKTRKQKYKGGESYGSVEELPHTILFSDIEDNKDLLTYITDPNDINSFEIDNVYYINRKNEQNYYKICVKKIENGLVYYTNEYAEGQTSGTISNRKNNQLKFNPNKIEHAYLVKEIFNYTLK